MVPCRAGLRNEVLTRKGVVVCGKVFEREAIFQGGYGVGGVGFVDERGTSG